MKKTDWNILTEEESQVIEAKGTEAPFLGEYDDFFKNGIFICKRCDAHLYRSIDKFNSHCGWPSFDDEVANTVKRKVDADGRRTEILCQQCDGHLGHVFHGEKKTLKDTRHCVNSLSLQFVPFEALFKAALAGDERIGMILVAGGCFWGVEQKFYDHPCVLATAVGYAGGVLEAPTYRQVCEGNTGHAETVAVIFDKTKIDSALLFEHFFAIHDPTQLNRQGLDVGRQYRSAIFTLDDTQAEQAESIIWRLKEGGVEVKTELEPYTAFWMAEEYHQKYFRKKHKNQ